MSTHKNQSRSGKYYVCSFIVHIAIVAWVILGSHAQSNSEELLEPIAVTVLEASEPTGDFVDPTPQEDIPMPPITTPEPEPVVEPPEPVAEPPEPVAEPPKPVVVTPPDPEPPKPELPKPEEVKKPDPPKPRKPTLEERIANGQKNATKIDKPKPVPAPPKRDIKADDIYKPGAAAVHGSENVAGRSTNEASAEQIYQSIVQKRVRQMWDSEFGPVGLNNPNPVKVSFVINSTGMVSNFRIVERSNDSAMNIAAKQLGDALAARPFTSFRQSGIQGLGSNPITVTALLKYEKN